MARKVGRVAPAAHNSAVRRSVARARNGGGGDGGDDGVTDAETVYCRVTRTRRRRHYIRGAYPYAFKRRPISRRRFVSFLPRFERKPENLHDEINSNATHTIRSHPQTANRCRRLHSYFKASLGTRRYNITVIRRESH